jgi:Coenzyme PQQ synthesis protein D (PqqD)
LGNVQDITEISSISRRRDLLEATLDDEVILLSVERGFYYSLDDIGSDIWQRIVTPCRVVDLCEALSKDYDADETTVANDVLPLLREMVSEGLIDVSG